MSDKPFKKKPPSKQLLAWLKKQATKLKSLVTCGWKLQADYLQNAKEKGEVLAEVRRRLDDTYMTFDEWVNECTDIGVSTAYVWMDVAEWWTEIEAHWIKVKKGDSNPLETSIRDVRNIVRTLRQAQGRGKPGSGRRPAKATARPNARVGDADGTIAPAAGTTELDEAMPVKVENEDVMTAPAGTTTAPGNVTSTQAGEADERGKQQVLNWEKAINEAEEPNITKKPEAKEKNYYTVMAISSDPADLASITLILPDPITTNTKGVVSVKAWVAKDKVEEVLHDIGKSLTQDHPKKLRLVIEL